MPDVDAVPSCEPYRASLRRSRERRAATARAARRRVRGRGTLVVLAATMSLATGGALATGSGGATAGKPPESRSAGLSAPLGPGDRGPLVKALQRRLRIPADGAFGPRTARAVTRFQRRRGLTPDGVVGAATAKALGLRVAKESLRTVAATGPEAALLERIARCESGGNPSAVSADGRYRGKYQFSRATWRAMGGTGDPAAAPEPEQDRLAARLLAARGTAPWPNCG